MKEGQKIYAVTVSLYSGKITVDLNKPETDYDKAFNQALDIIKEEINSANDDEYFIN